LLQEKEAKPFFSVIETLKTLMPIIAILENVTGIKQVMKKVACLTNKHDDFSKPSGCGAIRV